MLDVGLGDELGDRDGEFRRWSRLAFKKSCVEAGIEIKDPGTTASEADMARWKVVSNEAGESRGVQQIAKGGIKITLVVDNQ